MKVVILGGDGYLGWPTAMHMAAKGHEVHVVDNYLRRRLAAETRSEALIPTGDLEERADLFHTINGRRIAVHLFDCTDGERLSALIRDLCPDALVHYAEQPSAPFSMRGEAEARLTLENNLRSTFNVAWAVLTHAPDCHIVKLGTMGEYGTPNIDIEEGWITIEHKGRSDRFLYPRAGGSLYHTTKIMDTDLLSFHCRLYGLRVTDLMQGPVYGLSTAEADLHPGLVPNFHYDDIFGTVINRFLVQAVIGMPLTIYGRGGQKRGYINIRDTLRCVELSILNPAAAGELRIFNQFTEIFSIREIAERVQEAGTRLGLDVRVQHIDNPRRELEEHRYVAVHDGLLGLGLDPHRLDADALTAMLEMVACHKDRIDVGRILPRVRWNTPSGTP
ncbi:NAD-dependent epimerase/dehydratase family protein [Azospirillum sp. RWY-5-1]|uniref:NAD-dependent epimerase/dehydratase family protein n=2 Tax=Azospirillum oleiclasticum TaxID=2735135 RepID=A0ABX2TMR9_9PROT|nr:NAD-dependent epimerase/dehydratase family protein [Azospirillum oleiclasticum]NYZ14512.1 NAD-dependent epimerase/dehydratase family protein [Azospirillum oleiclasticum]NYZ24290.1 NAD-dependent epimerase/dehydratase family protein [Azospirillum oleiclasticum]